MPHWVRAHAAVGEFGEPQPVPRILPEQQAIARFSMAVRLVR